MSPVKSECLSGCRRGLEIDEAITSITTIEFLSAPSNHDTKVTFSSPSELVANHLDVDLLAHAIPQASNEVFVDPRLEFAHPKIISGFFARFK